MNPWTYRPTAARYDAAHENHDFQRAARMAETWAPLWPTAYDAAMWRWVVRKLTGAA